MKDYLETKFKNKKILILGFGREGQSTLKILRDNLTDQVIGIADEEIKETGDPKTIVFFGKDYLDHLNEFEIIIKSPGISMLKKEIQTALSNGIEITSQTKIFFDICRGTIIGITGTKGKSTTASLIYEMLVKGGKNSQLVGNIGSPVLDSISSNSKDTYFVFEMSSHQLFDLTKSPHISIVTNVAVDHLDWYRNFENYVDAKSNIIKYQKETDISILNNDNLIAKGFDRFAKAKVFYTSKITTQRGAYIADGNIYLKIDDSTEVLGKCSEIKLIGAHNLDNVMQAAVAVKTVGIKNEDIWAAATSFKQLPHHLEFVREVGGIKFYNDSFAVDQIATIAAINSFKENLTLILGGYDRGIDYMELSVEIAKSNNVKTVILIGQIADQLRKYLRRGKFTGKVINLGKVKMDKVVSIAVGQTKPGGIVLFSPAAASFDMFKDYKDRGEQFCKAVLELK